MMMQTPLSSVSSNRRYMSIFFVVATILLLLATLHVSRDGVPEVIKSSTGWGNPPAAPPPAQEHAKPAQAYSHGDKHDNRPTFYDLAVNSGTDKVTSHTFNVLYDKYLPALRDGPVRMLEIGLGCDMGYGPGASFETWIKYFPQLEINIIEYDAVCGKKWGAEHPKATVYLGDQSDAPFLHKTAAAATADGGLFDLVLDDGGHSMEQQEVSLRQLWQYVRPGGLYIIEDLHTSYLTRYKGDPTRVDTATRTFMKMVYEILDDIMSVEAINYHVETIAPPKYPFSHEISSIDCMQAMCVLVKKEVGAR